MSTEAIQLMLADLRWTRRLASSLARDAAEADDLWSESWAAARRARKSVHRGWIATTMRNVVRMSRRAEKRRLQRELASADLADAPRTPEELLSHVELQRTLAELVSGLAEPYRLMLLLHHVEDLAPVEIARRLAIPAGTVRWRLKVAHDQLRDRLIERSGGDRDAWRLALLPLLPRGGSASLDESAQRSGPTAPTKGGTTMMAWKLLVMLGGLAAAGVAIQGGRAVTANLTNRGGNTKSTTGVWGAAPPAPSAGPTAAVGKGGSKASPATREKCEDCARHRAFAVPSAAIADFEAPDLDACFASVPVAETYRRVDLSLTLSRSNGIATINSAKVKFATDELAKMPGVLDCLSRSVVGRDMPNPNTSGPAELAILVGDSVRRVDVPTSQLAGGKVPRDAQAPFLGEPGSRLTVTVFTDFQCPFCWRYAARLQSLAELYPGQLRIEVRNDPLPFHAQAELAAEAALAAHEQGKFWPMHDELFANQTSLDREHLRAIAKQVGLDVARFDQSLDDGREKARVQSDIDAAKRLGIRGVPTMVIGDELVVGARPLEELARHIDRALAAKTK